MHNYLSLGIIHPEEEEEDAAEPPKRDREPRKSSISEAGAEDLPGD